MPTGKASLSYATPKICVSMRAPIAVSVDSFTITKVNDYERILPTGDSHVVVIVPKIDIAVPVLHSSISVQIRERAARCDFSRIKAQLRVVRFRTYGVHPCLAGAGIKLQTDCLAWRADGDVDGVKGARKPGLGARIQLALRDIFDEGGSKGCLQGEGEDAILLRSVSSHGVEEGSGQRGQDKTGTHLGNQLQKVQVSSEWQSTIATSTTSPTGGVV